MEFTIPYLYYSCFVFQQKQHNFVYGLASEKTSDTQEMAKGTKDYDVITSHSFVDGLINGLTFLT